MITRDDLIPISVPQQILDSAAEYAQASPSEHAAFEYNGHRYLAERVKIIDLDKLPIEIQILVSLGIAPRAWSAATEIDPSGGPVMQVDADGVHERPIGVPPIENGSLDDAIEALVDFLNDKY